MPPARARDLEFYRWQLKQQEPLRRDTWIATHSPISAEKLHALGYMNFAWNGCEHDLFSLLAAVMQVPEAEAWVHAHDLGDIAIITRIKYLAKRRYRDIEAIETIINVLEVYERCRLNRNQLTHFSIAAAGGKWGISLTRHGKKPDQRFGGTFPDDLWDIRRVAREIRQLGRQLRIIWSSLMFRDKGGVRPWPKKLRVPELLWKAPPAYPKASKHQRQPSRKTRKFGGQA